MNPKLLLPAMALSTSLLLCSCAGEPQKNTETEKTTVAAVENAAPKNAQSAGDQQVLQESVLFYQSVMEGNFDKALDMLHPKAIEATPKSQWLALLQDTQAKFGKLLKTDVIDSRKYDQVNTAVGKADYYQVAFKNVYEKGTLYEMLSFVKPDGAAKPLMLSYTYDSDKSKLKFETF